MTQPANFTRILPVLQACVTNYPKPFAIGPRATLAPETIRIYFSRAKKQLADPTFSHDFSPDAINRISEYIPHINENNILSFYTNQVPISTSPARPTEQITIASPTPDEITVFLALLHTNRLQVSVQIPFTQPNLDLVQSLTSSTYPNVSASSNPDFITLF